jgi:hypothetical protein
MSNGLTPFLFLCENLPSFFDKSSSPLAQHLLSNGGRPPSFSDFHGRGYAELTQYHIGAVKSGSAQVSQRMEAEIAHVSLSAKSRHYSFPLLVRAFYPLPFLFIPVARREDPWFPLIPVFVPMRENLP